MVALPPLPSARMAGISCRQLTTSCRRRTTVRVWDMFSGKEMARIIHEHGVTSMAVSPNGKYVASADGFVARVWNIEDRVEAARKGYDRPVTCSAFSSDGQYVA